MNMQLHGIGSSIRVPIKVTDAPAADPSDRYQIALADPPSLAKISEEGQHGDRR